MSTCAAVGPVASCQRLLLHASRVSSEKRMSSRNPSHLNIWFSALSSSPNKVTCCFQNQVKVNRGTGCFDKQTSFHLVNKRKRKKKKKAKANLVKRSRNGWAAHHTFEESKNIDIRALRQPICYDDKLVLLEICYYVAAS